MFSSLIVVVCVLLCTALSANAYSAGMIQRGSLTKLQGWRGAGAATPVVSSGRPSYGRPVGGGGGAKKGSYGPGKSTQEIKARAQAAGAWSPSSGRSAYSAPAAPSTPYSAPSTPAYSAPKPAYSSPAPVAAAPRSSGVAPASAGGWRGAAASAAPSRPSSFSGVAPARGVGGGMGGGVKGSYGPGKSTQEIRAKAQASGAWTPRSGGSAYSAPAAPSTPSYSAPSTPAYSAPKPAYSSPAPVAAAPRPSGVAPASTGGWRGAAASAAPSRPSSFSGVAPARR